MKKRGVSPIVSTVLLIVIVVVVAIIIFFWAKSFIDEKTEKFDKPVESVCKEVKLRASVEGSRLLLVNQGNVPIYSININKISPGRAEVENKVVNLDKGNSKNDSISTAGATSIIINPVLLGKSGDQKREYVCEDYDVEVVL
jgi:flagellin-like protein